MRSTVQSRADRANAREAARAPLLAATGAIPAVTVDEARLSAARWDGLCREQMARVARGQVDAVARVAWVREQIGGLCWELLAACDAGAAFLTRNDLEPILAADHWSSVYREVFGRLPPWLAHVERGWLWVERELVRRASGAEQLGLGLDGAEP